MRTDPTIDPERAGPHVESDFRSWLKRIPAPVVIEIGTLRSNPDHPTHHRDWAPHAAYYGGIDIVAGPDVDIVADAHHLEDAHIPGNVDAVIACSTLEHLARPWRAVPSMARLLKPGGRLYIRTHHTFPEHGYPDDYWRFSRTALAMLLRDARLDHVETCYEHPATIVPHPSVTEWNPAAPAWLTVHAAGCRPLPQ